MCGWHGQGLFTIENYFVLSNCIRHCVREEFIQNYLKIFSFVLFWDPIPVDREQSPLDTSPQGCTVKKVF